MNILDIIILIFLLLGIVRGFMRGLFVEVASLVALVAGIYGAIHFSHYASEFLTQHVEWEEKYINVAAFAVTFIIIVLVIALAGRALTKLADFAALGIFNKILGALFGGLKIGLILSIIMMVLDNADRTFGFLDEETKKESALYEPIQSIAPAIFPALVEAADKIEEKLDENLIKEKK
ncbi:membrane protein required for colicin V production [Flavobacteriaceae bacterium MAR_2010_188]|nr:membrane protein required for colicin V production [Flavobacteriaceae bacterium MAR_2010_188]